MNTKLLFALPALLPLVSCESECVQKSPNIIFILADDMGYGDVSCFNSESKIQTKNIDALAAEGVMYTDAHTSSSVSTPTRYGVMTGRYNWRSTLKSGVLKGYNKALIEADRSTMATMLGKSGYTTAFIGKWHLGWDWNNIDAGEENVDFSKPITNGPTTRGFDYCYALHASLDFPPYVYVENELATAIPVDETESKTKYGWWRKGLTAPNFSHEQMLPHITDKACQYIAEKANGEEPFFLYLPFPAPHTPILPLDEFVGKSGLGPYGDYALEVDAMVGKVMAMLEAQGIADNTLVVFTADNGCSPAAHIDELQAHGHEPNYHFRGTKADLFDGGHRVPCVVRWTGGVKPHTVDQTICLTDFYATFASLVGYEIQDTEAEDSYDMMPTLLSCEAVEPIREATVHHSVSGHFAIRKGDWKLLLSPSSGGWSFPHPAKDKEVIATLPPMQLYNMKDDISETTNLYAERPEIVEELTALMTKYVKDGRSTPGAPQKNDGEEHWKELTWM